MNGTRDDLLPAFCGKRMLILGCGNRLLGDDGFGPAVIEHLLAHHEIPDDVYVMDVGTGVRKLLFTLSLSPDRPQRIVIIDAVDKGRTPGEILELLPEDLPREKIDDFSLHQVPSSNLARELREAGVDVCILCCQTEIIPQSVKPGLSASLRSAVPMMCDRIAKEIQLYAKAN
jgi:coenzyme F420 hydrogenase subunit delta